MGGARSRPRARELTPFPFVLLGPCSTTLRVSFVSAFSCSRHPTPPQLTLTERIARANSASTPSPSALEMLLEREGTFSLCCPSSSNYSPRSSWTKPDLSPLRLSLDRNHLQQEPTWTYKIV